MMDRIIGLNDYRNKARVVAGYCWDWVSKKQGAAGEHDIVLEEFGFRRHWNLAVDGSLWVQVPSSVHEVGCIHTCQGLEVDHIGVIIGPDLVVRNGRVVVRPEMRSRQDQSIKGYKKLLREDPQRRIRAQQRESGPPRAPEAIVPAFDLKMDARGGTISPNQEQSWSPAGGTTQFIFQFQVEDRQ